MDYFVTINSMELTVKNIAALLVIIAMIAMSLRLAVEQYHIHVIAKQDSIAKDAAFQHELEVIDQNAVKKKLPQ